MPQGFISVGPGLWLSFSSIHISHGSGSWSRVSEAWQSLGSGSWIRIWYAGNAPTGLTASSSNACQNNYFPEPRVTLNWTSNPLLETNIYRDSTYIGNVAAGVQTFTDTTEPVGTYQYNVREFDPNTNSESDATIVTVSVSNTCSTPPPPFLEAAYDVSSCFLGQTTYKCQVQWNPFDAGMQTRVFRNGGLVGTAAPGITSFTDVPVPGPGSYTYTLRSYWKGNESGDSDPLIVNVINPLCF
jgi:hypothetical protein